MVIWKLWRFVFVLNRLLIDDIQTFKYVQILLNKGADPSIKNDLGHDASVVLFITSRVAWLAGKRTT